MQIAPRGYTADETIPVSRFVAHDGTKEHRVIVATGSIPIVGVSQEGGKFAPIPGITTDPPSAAEVDDPIAVYMPGCYALVRVGTGGVTAGGRVKSDSTGQAIAITQTAGTKEYLGGRAENTVAEGGLALIYIAPQVLTTET